MMSPGCEHDGAVGGAFVREGVDVAGAPMIEAAGRFRIAVLAHGRVFAEIDREVGAAGARDPHGLGAFEPLVGMDDRLLEAGRRQQFLEFVRPVDHHQHAGAGVARLLQPAREQRDVQADQHVGRFDRLERAFAAPDRFDADLGPRRHGVDAHFVGIRAEILRRRESRGDVVAPRPEIAQQDNRLALLHVAELKFLPEQHRELGVIDSFMHVASLPTSCLNISKICD